MTPLTVGKVEFGPAPDKLAHFEGGASRSEHKPDYALVNPCAIEAIAKRMTEGLKKYGRMNYRQGGDQFVLETFNHMVEHLLKFGEGDPSDNHLDAVGANFNILCWYRCHKPESFRLLHFNAAQSENETAKKVSKLKRAISGCRALLSGTA